MLKPSPAKQKWQKSIFVILILLSELVAWVWGNGLKVGEINEWVVESRSCSSF